MKVNPITKNKSVKIYKRKVIRNLSSMQLVIADLKYNSSYSEKKLIVDYYKMNKHFPGSHYFFRGMVAKNIKEIMSTRYIPFDDEASLISELEWCIQLLIHYEDEINEYLIMKKKYEALLIQENVMEAKRILDSINEITYSLWGLEQTMSISEIEGGFKKNREKLSELANLTNEYILLRFCELFSFKAEKQSTYSNFIHKLNSLFRNYENSFTKALLQDYFHFQLDILNNNIGSDTLKRVLSFSSTLPCIDIYENVIKICSIIVSNEKYKEYASQAIYLLSKLNINDFRIRNIRLLSECCSLEEFDFVDLARGSINQIIEAYTQGNYDECITSIKELDAEIVPFNVYEILAKCIINKNVELGSFDLTKCNVKENILLPVYNILICNQKNKNLSYLLDFAKRIGNLSITQEIISYYSRHIALDDKLRDSRKKIADINEYQITPRFMFSLVNKEIFLHKFESTGLYRSTVALFFAYVKNSFNESVLESIPEERLRLYKIKSLRQIDPKRAIAESEKFLTSFTNSQEKVLKKTDYFYYERTLNELYSLYLDQKLIEHAIDLYVESYFINSDMVIRINHGAIIDYFNTNRLQVKTIKNIIFNHIVDEKNYGLLFKSLINFLNANAMNAPSELIQWAKDNEKVKSEVIYILSKVCSKEVMKRFYRLTPKTRNEERIKILSYLIEVDKSQHSKYIEEINEITKLQSVQERVKSIVEKKIYVDIGAIMSEQETILREKYNRFIALKSLDKELNFYDLSKQVNIAQISNNIRIEISEDQEKEQKYLMYKEIVNDIFNEFLFNPKFGLANFLSSRIRHGLLESNLSSTFKNYHLFSLKVDSTHDDFMVNSFWDEYMIDSDDNRESHLDKVKSLLSEFTKKIVRKIDEVKNWIRISDNFHQHGMFDYRRFIEDSYLIILYASLNLSSYESFTEDIIRNFWAITEINARNIRKRITAELYDYFFGILNELRIEAEILRQADPRNEMYITLIKQINLCQTAIKNDLNSFSQWFVVRKQIDHPDYNFNDLISTCETIINKQNKQYTKINFSREITTSSLLKGDTFSYMLDILINLYTNAIKHSGLQFEKQYIDIEVTEVSNLESVRLLELNRDQISGELLGSIKKFKESTYETLRICIKNKLSEETIIDDIERKLLDAINKIKNPEQYRKDVVEEGGSGLLKINNLLKYNLSALFFQLYKIEDIKGEYWFESNININLDSLVAEKENENALVASGR